MLALNCQSISGKIRVVSWLFYCRPPVFFFFHAGDGIRDATVTGVQTCALPILGMFAHVVMLFARTDASAKARGVTAFAVPLDAPGVNRSPLRDLGSHCIGRAVLSFDHVRIPASHRLGEEGTGFYQVMRGFDFNRVFIALVCLGSAQASLDETMAYVTERKAFGTPIAQFEGVSFPIAEP